MITVVSFYLISFFINIHLTQNSPSNAQNPTTNFLLHREALTLNIT